MNLIYLIPFLLLPFIIGTANAQTIINVTSSTPCWQNYTAGVQMWQNCGYDTDFIKAAIAPFEWITGGLFSMIVVSIIIVMVGLKYHTVIYPIMIGIILFPLSSFLFAQEFLSIALILASVGCGAIIVRAFINNTSE